MGAGEGESCPKSASKRSRKVARPGSSESTIFDLGLQTQATQTDEECTSPEAAECEALLQRVLAVAELAIRISCDMVAMDDGLEVADVSASVRSSMDRSLSELEPDGSPTRIEVAEAAERLAEAMAASITVARPACTARLRLAMATCEKECTALKKDRDQWRVAARSLEAMSRVEAFQDRSKKTVEKAALAGEARLLPGIEEWLKKHGMDKKAAAGALRWCAVHGHISQVDAIQHLYEHGSSSVDQLLEHLNLEEVDAANVRQSLATEQEELKQRWLDEREKMTQRQAEADTMARQYDEMLVEACELVRALEREEASEREIVAVKKAAQVRKQQGRKARTSLASLRRRYVVASTPFYSLDMTDVVEELKALAKQPDGPLLAFDWPGSQNARRQDGSVFERATALARRWKEGGGSAAVLQQLADVLTYTFWFQCYKGGVKGAVRALATASPEAVVTVICIEGGPMSRAEALNMPQIIEEVKLELFAKGQPNVAIEVQMLPTVKDFGHLVMARNNFLDKLDIQAAQHSELADQQDWQKQPREKERSHVSLGRTTDHLVASWKRHSDRLKSSNERLWRGMPSKRTIKQTHDLMMLQADMAWLENKTEVLRQEFRGGAGPGSTTPTLGLSQSLSLPRLP